MCSSITSLVLCYCEFLGSFMERPLSGSTPHRPEFRQWVDTKPDPGWALLPLTHVTKGIGALDIIREGIIKAAHCDVFKAPRAYFFYGRPAYRVSGDGAIKVEAACPICFIFDAVLLKTADGVYAFDTGAFAKRLYKHTNLDEMNISDFSIGGDPSRPNRIIAHVFGTAEAYFDGNVSEAASPETGAEPWEFLARAYLHLLKSTGRNEPDDRICSIEVTFDRDVSLAPDLKAVVIPHTLWSGDQQAPWLVGLKQNGVEIRPYYFAPGRHPEHYHAIIEMQVRDLYREWNVLS